MRETKTILLVGVGGQGTILTSTILSKGLVAAGYDVKMSEIHGMAQRGGSVSTQVRYGDKVRSPIVGRSGADVLVAFELMEAARWLGFMKANGKAIVNDLEIPPAPVLMGAVEYPKGLIEAIGAKLETTAIKADAIAAKLGMPRAMNMVLLGALTEASGLTNIDWEDIIAGTVKPAFIDVNIAAYRAGRSAAGSPVETFAMASSA